MRPFSVAASRYRLSGPDGAVEGTLKRDLQSAQQLHGVTSSARHFLAQAVECVLAGLDDLADSVLRQTRTWLTVAIEVSEVPSRSDYGDPQGRRYADLALCNWLLDNRHDGESLGRAIDHLEKGLATAQEDDEDRAGVLTVLFWVCLDAGDYSRIARLGDQYNAFRPPPAGRLSEVGVHIGKMCRILAHHELGLGYTDEEVSSCVESFTPSFVRSALESRFFESAARWMKARHWRGRGESPSPSARDVVRLCLTDEYA